MSGGSDRGCAQVGGAFFSIPFKGGGFGIYIAFVVSSAVSAAPPQKDKFEFEIIGNVFDLFFTCCVLRFFACDSCSFSE